MPFQVLVASFRLAIGLRMIGSGQLGLDPKSLAEGLPDGCYELGASVGYDGGWQSVQSEHVFDQDINGGVGGGAVIPRIAGYVMALLYQPISGYKDYIIAIRKWQSRYEVDYDILLVFLGYGEGVQQSMFPIP